MFRSKKIVFVYRYSTCHAKYMSIQQLVQWRALCIWVHTALDTEYMSANTPTDAMQTAYRLPTYAGDTICLVGGTHAPSLRIIITHIVSNHLNHGDITSITDKYLDWCIPNATFDFGVVKCPSFLRNTSRRCFLEWAMACVVPIKHCFFDLTRQDRVFRSRNYAGYHHLGGVFDKPPPLLLRKEES